MSRTTRREFAKTLAAASAALPISLAAEEKSPSLLGTALTALVRAEYGQFLSEDEMARVGKDFQDHAPYLENLRKFELKNSDAP